MELMPIALKPYCKSFFWVYLGAIIVTVIIVLFLERSGIQGGSIAAQVASLIAGTLWASQKFVRDQGRFFTSKELNRMVWITTLMVIIFQVIMIGVFLALIMYLLSTAKNLPPDTAASFKESTAAYTALLHNPTSWLLMLLFTTVLTYVVQTLNFRFIARRMAKATLAAKK